MLNWRSSANQIKIADANSYGISNIMYYSFYIFFFISASNINIFQNRTVNILYAMKKNHILSWFRHTLRTKKWKWKKKKQQKTTNNTHAHFIFIHLFLLKSKSEFHFVFCFFHLIFHLPVYCFSINSRINKSLSKVLCFVFVCAK